MKWPSSLTIIRHGQSAYNILRAAKKADPEYNEFVREFNRDISSARTRELALRMMERYGGKTSDYATPLTEEGRTQAQYVGFNILDRVEQPDVVFVSPYLRTKQTFDCMRDACSPKLQSVPVIYDDRVREQEHGLSVLYGDWRIFYVFHPEQQLLKKLQGDYWYQYPNGESVSMVRERLRSFLSTLTREYAGKHVWVVSHHLTKLSIRANLERLSPEGFEAIDKNDKPINCGVTIYKGRPDLGTDGKLVLADYNVKLY